MNVVQQKAGETAQVHRRQGTIDALGAETYYVFDPAGNTVSQVDALASATYYVYDKLNRQSAVVDALGGKTYYNFDAVGNQTCVINPLSYPAYFRYDALNRQSASTDALGATSYFLYDAAGRQTVVIDPLSHASYFQYDPLGRQVASTNPLGYTGYFSYDAAGQQVVQIDPRGYPTYFVYDLAGRQSAVTDALGWSSYFHYDLAGRQVVQVPPDGAVVYYRYDKVGRLEAVTDALGASAYYRYDLAGSRTASVDALGYATYYYYDAVSRLFAVRDAADGVLYYVYDALGRRTAVKDQRGYASYFAYDRLSRLTTELDPLGQATYYSFDAAGSLIARTDGRGQTAYFAYDQVARQVRAIYAGVAPVYFTYDLAGNRTMMQDEWGATYWSYDALGRPTRRHDPRGTVVTYAYGPSGERTELTVAGQGTVYYRYNEVGSMTSVLDGKTGLQTSYDYDPGRRVRRQCHPNAAATYFLYDAAGRLTEKVTKKDADGSVLVRFAYTRDAAGNPIAIERESALGVFYYQHDRLQRLAYEGQFVSAARQYENYYEFDPAANRRLLRHGETAAENLTYYDYNAANELTQLHDKDGWTYFAYDQNGNTVMEQTPSYTRYFQWDGRDMLTGVRSTEQGWTDDVIRYDGLASRASVVDSTGMTYYSWDGIRVLKTEDGAHTLKQRQAHGYSPVPSVGDIALMESAAGDIYSPIPDQIGTLWKILSSTATTANSYSYDAYGVSRSVSETFANPFGFAGKPLDPDPALYHFIGRQYESTLGRFTTRDPYARPRASLSVQFHYPVRRCWDNARASWCPSEILPAWIWARIAEPAWIRSASLAEWVSTIAALSVFVGRRLPGGKAQMVVPAYTYVNSQPTLRRDVTGLSDCSDFVDLLVARGADYKKCWFFRKCRLGYEIAESYGGLGPGIDYPRAKVPSIPTGFWPFLTMGGQGSEVYRHIAGSVGALLCGAESRWEAQVRSDWRQYQDSGELERLAEILDDYAGFMVASVLGSFVDCSMTQEQAKFALDLILCEPGFVTWFRQMFREYSK